MEMNFVSLDKQSYAGQTKSGRTDKVMQGELFYRRSGNGLTVVVHTFFLKIFSGKF